MRGRRLRVPAIVAGVVLSMTALAVDAPAVKANATAAVDSVKDAAKTAGHNVAEGARKTGHAVHRGARKAGHAAHRALNKAKAKDKHHTSTEANGATDAH